MLETKNYEEYLAQVKTKFRLLNTEPELELILQEVTERQSNSRQEYFSLMFRGSGEYFLPQQSYLLRHDDLGEGFLFLVPIGRDENGFQYEAAFNRIIVNSEKLEAVKSSD